MSRAVLDDHLPPDLLADDVPAGLTDVLAAHEPATTNLYLHRLSTLGAEGVAEHLGGPLCVWDGDDGPGIQQAMASLGLLYRTVGR